MITTPIPHTKSKTANRPLTTPAPSWMTQDVCFPAKGNYVERRTGLLLVVVRREVARYE